MNLLKEDENLVRTRKYENILTVCGRGAFLFGFWSVIKLVLYLALGYRAAEDLKVYSEEARISAGLFSAMMVILSILYLVLRCLAAGAAVRAGKGGSVRIPAILLTVLLAASSASDVYAIICVPGHFRELEDTAVSVLVEFTSFLNLCEIALYSWKLRRLRMTGTQSLSENRKEEC